MKSNIHKTIVARVLTAALAICLMVCLLPTDASAVNKAVTDVRNGVLQVNLVYTTNTGDQIVVSTGTGFLVNPTTIVTCDHCVTLDEESMLALADMMNTDVGAVKRSLSCSVTVSRDVTISASVKQNSYEMDFAILSLSQPLQKATPLKIRTNPVEQTETVYAVGFPALPALQQNYSTFTSADATITSGVVNKVSSGTNPYSGASTDYIMTSCDLDNGNSGGPMVDENGAVIGVCQSVITSDASSLSPEFYYAVEISQVVEIMDQMGIQYDEYDSDDGDDIDEDETGSNNEDDDDSNKGSNNEDDDDSNKGSEDKKDSKDDKDSEKETMPEADDEDSKDSEEEDNNMMLILIIAGAAVVVVIIIVVIVLVAGGKKPVAPANVPPAPPVPPVTPNHIPGGFTPAAPQVPHNYNNYNNNNNGYTAPVAPAAGETTILSQGAGETTVLSRSVNGGALIRKRTGENVSINAEQFVIGRERRSVNYCVSDNTSISRSHIRLIVRNGITYLTDLNAANGTYVNGVKAVPRQEIALKNGDKITLADEEFEYRN